MSYAAWKYSNTSEKIKMFFGILMIAYVIFYFLFLYTPLKTIHLKDLQPINGLVQSFQILGGNKTPRIAYLELKNFPDKLFVFDTRAEYAPLKIRNGDFVEILVSKEDVGKNSNRISSFELRKGETFAFSMDKYNSSLREGSILSIILLWIAIIYIALYFFLKKSGIFKWAQKQLASPDPNFQSEQPRFNEYLDPDR